MPMRLFTLAKDPPRWQWRMTGSADLAYVVQGQGPAIRYAFRDASGWHGEFFGTGVDVPPAVDHTGSPHVVYGEYGMLYAFRDATGWHDEMTNADCMVSTGIPLRWMPKTRRTFRVTATMEVLHLS